MDENGRTPDEVGRRRPLPPIRRRFADPVKSVAAVITGAYGDAMSEEELREQWRRDALLLGAIGHRLAQVELPTVTIRLPHELAEPAAAAGNRDDGAGPLGPEDAAARLARHRAGTLALIGAAVRERGRREGDEVGVELGAELIALALDAGDDVSA